MTKKNPLFYYCQVPGLDSRFVFPTEYQFQDSILKQMKKFTCTSDNMCITHEEWCTVQMGGRQQSSTDMHLDTELAVDKGWERASTTKKSIMF